MYKVSTLRSEGSSSKGFRSKFRVPSLLLAGAVTLAGLSVSRDARALSGTLTSSQVVTSPRESGGATGGATLIHTAATSSASTSEATTTSTTTAPPEEASSSARTTASSSGSSRRRAQAEEGRNRRRGSTTTETASSTTSGRRRARTTTGGGKAVAESKDKVVAPVAPPPERPVFSISTGFESRYIFHGLDIISFNTDQLPGEAKSSPIYYVGGDVSYKGGHFGVTFVQSIDRLRPFISSFFYGDPHKKFYQELDFNLDYTAHVIGGILDATVGYNSYVFLNSDFKGSNYQGEVLFRLAYKQIPYVTPSFSYYYYASEYHDTRVGSLNGSLVEFRVDGLFPIYKWVDGSSISFAPYVSSAYNINYLNWDHPSPTNPGNNVGGWSYLETGVKIPVTFRRHFTITPYANYGADLTEHGTLPIDSHAYAGGGRKAIFGDTTSFWFGVTATYTF